MKSATITFTSVLLFILVFSFLTSNVGAAQARRQRGGWRLFPRDTAHWLGWIGFILLGVSAAYSGLKRGFPQNIRLWLTIHCIPGILSFILVGMHVINKVLHIRPGMLLSFLAFILMGVIVIGGIVGRYAKKGILSNYWRMLHIPLTALFYILLALHLLGKTGLLAI
ncbi:MAG: hypothetical protein QXF26_05805 [Candidatus Bathyarchaeia archaeon]